MLSLHFGQRSDHLTPFPVPARWLFVGALSIWVIAFVAIRAWALAHGGAPLRWDASWYVDVANGGYRFNGNIASQQNVAFLPAYPYVLRLFLALGLQAPAAVLAMNLLCGVGGAALFFRALSAQTSATTGAWACALFVAAPFSLYFLNGYSESLYFLCMAAFWWGLWSRRDDGLAALFAALAGLVRPFGLLLALVWAVDVACRGRQSGQSWGRVATRVVTLAPLAIAGPLVICLYDDYRFGDLFLYRNILIAWGADVVSNGWPDFVNHLRIEWHMLAELHPTLILTFSTELARLLFWISIAVMLATARRAPIGVTLYGIGLVAFLLVSTEGAANLGRHLATNLSLPLGIALLTSPAPSAAARPRDFWRVGLLALIFVVSMDLQMQLVLRYFQGLWVS
jgi:hypothetical protein